MTTETLRWQTELLEMIEEYGRERHSAGISLGNYDKGGARQSDQSADETLGQIRAHLAAACGAWVVPAPHPQNTAARISMDPQAARERAAVEAAARDIHEAWKGVEGWVPWVDGGNSIKQDEARRLARSNLAARL